MSGSGLTETDALERFLSVVGRICRESRALVLRVLNVKSQAGCGAPRSNPSIQGSSRLQVYLWLHSKFEVSLGYMRKNKEERRREREKEKKAKKKSPCNGIFLGGMTSGK